MLLFARKRMRRGRRTKALRALARETTVTENDLILPVFAVAGENREEPVHSMPGVVRRSVDLLRIWIPHIKSRAVLLFGVPDHEQKDEQGRSAILEDGIVPTAVKAIKEERPDLLVVTDVCLCAYMSHGHCGVLRADKEVDNDKTLEILGEMATVHAAAGADVVAPSGMMDGQVKAIREALDEAEYSQTCIMSYAAKFASSFYGPFREASSSSPGFGDRCAYQLPPANRREAIEDALLDVQEGADWLMVKPAMPYLDVLSELRSATRLPIAAYQVSGEYAMLKCAAKAEALDERRTVSEALTCIKRAGADAIITYYAEQMIEWLGKGKG